MGWCLGLAAALHPGTEARAQAPGFTLPALPLTLAIERLSGLSGASIGAEGALPALRTRAVRHAGSVAAALEQMLAGTGWTARPIGPAAWRIEPAPRPAPVAEVAGTQIVVTAAKRPLALDRAAYAIAVASFAPGGAGNAAVGSARVADDTEGLTLTAFGPGRNRMFLRGVADSPFDGNSQSTVALLLDEARVTWSAPDPDLRLVDVERVELLKGPQGSLYGVGTLGGIYHIVTRRADVDAAGGSATFGIAAIDGGGVGASGSAVANVPIARGTAALRLVAYTAQMPGWIDTGTRKDSNASHVEGGRGDLGVETAGWRFDLSGAMQRLNTADTQYVYAPGARTRPAQLAEPHDNDFNDVAARAAGMIGAVHAQAALSYAWHEVRDTADATQGADSFALADPQTFIDARHYRVLDAEARFNGRFWRIAWLAGIEHLSAQEDESRSLTAPAQVLVIDTMHQAEENTGLFVDLTLPLTHRLSIEAGGRLYHSLFTAQSTATAASAHEHDERVAITPSLAVIWQLGGDGVAWLRYGSAYRQGGVDAATTARDKHFRGDEVSTFEAGWRSRLPGGGRIDADAYVTLWDDVQADMLQPDGLIATQNAGRARILGIEATANTPIAHGFRLTFGATAQSARLVESNPGFAADDRRLPVVPVYTLRAGIDHDLALAGGHGTLHIGLRQIGPARLSFDPALDRPMGNVLDSEATASLVRGRMRVDMRIDNLLNRAGDTFAFGNAFRAAVPQYTPQEPRRISLALTRRF